MTSPLEPPFTIIIRDFPLPRLIFLMGTSSSSLQIRPSCPPVSYILSCLVTPTPHLKRWEMFHFFGTGIQWKYHGDMIYKNLYHFMGIWHKQESDLWGVWKRWFILIYGNPWEIHDSMMINNWILTLACGTICIHLCYKERASNDNKVDAHFTWLRKRQTKAGKSKEALYIYINKPI